MATELTTLDIKQLAKQHSAMQREIAEWREWWHELDEFGEPRFEEMGVRLGRFHEELAAHFQLEEESGFFESMLRHHPDRRGEIAGFRRQHHELLSALEELVKRLSSPESGYNMWGAAREDFEQFLNDLYAHEAAEGGLGSGAAAAAGGMRPPSK